MESSVRGLTKLGYEALYVVPATYLYLLATDPVVSVPLLDITTTGWLAALFLALSLYAAIWLHRIDLLVYGDHAGLKSVCPRNIAKKHEVHFSTGVDVADLPDINNKYFIRYRLLFSALYAKGFQWRKSLRALPAWPFSSYTGIAWVWLTYHFIETGGSLVAGGLWLILSILIFRGAITSCLPPYIPSDSVVEYGEPHYITTRRRIANQNNSKTSRPRIKTRESTNSAPEVR